jgi:hypothetical protein
MNLREWTILYVKHKDLFARKLKDYKDEGERLVFNFKDHTMHAYAMEQLDIPKVEGKTLLTTMNSKGNMKFLVDNWNEFSKHAHLTIVFVNPETNEKWFIIPHTHAQIADPNIELGLKSLAENVTLVG